jgi:hypothetical protein
MSIHLETTQLSRLEANKVRTLFRYLFSLGLLITGIDGLTPDMVIAWTPLASDILSTTISLSFCIALVVSVMIYLPRTYGPQYSSAKVMVGFHNRPSSAAAAARSPLSPISHHKESSGLARSKGRNPFRRSISQMQSQVGGAEASQFALMSLLREGGQWEGEEDILRDVHGHGLHSPLTPLSGRARQDDAERGEMRRRVPGLETGVYEQEGRADAKTRKGSLGSLVREVTPVNEWNERPTLPAAVSPRIALPSKAGVLSSWSRKDADEQLQNFTSPIAPHVEPKVTNGPVEIRIRVEQQVHHDQ